jgi:hypothetical protein
MVVVSLVTLGSPDQVTGGYLYHRRLADAASGHSVEIVFVSFPNGAFLTSALRAGEVIARARSRGADLIVVDSIAAWLLAPWLATHELDLPMVAILHQPPGGIDHGRVLTPVRAASSQWGFLGPSSGSYPRVEMSPALPKAEPRTFAPHAVLPSCASGTGSRARESFPFSTRFPGCRLRLPFCIWSAIRTRIALTPPG